MKVRLFKSLTPLCYNLKKWNLLYSPILIITGLSGSGKTTLAKKIAKMNNATLVSLDVLKFYSESTKQSQKILDIFLEKHPEINELVQIHWSKIDKLDSNNILYNYYCNLFFDFLIEYSKETNKKIILEGIQIFVRLHPSKSVGLPIIIVRNSSLKSFLNKLRRDYHSKILFFEKIKFINCLFKDTYTYQLKQRKLLNQYVDYLSAVNEHTKRRNNARI